MTGEALEADVYEMVLYVITEATTESAYKTKLTHPALMDEFSVANYQDARGSKEFAMGRSRVRALWHTTISRLLFPEPERGAHDMKYLDLVLEIQHTGLHETTKTNYF